MLSRRRFLSFSGGLAATGFSTATYGVGVEPLRLGVTDYHVRPRNWPAGLKLKIAAIADIHACDPWMSLAHIEGIVARTNTLQPDLVVLNEADYYACFAAARIESDCVKRFYCHGAELPFAVMRSSSRRSNDFTSGELRLISA